ncbi:MAG: hypothetical protein D6734_00250 [Candidatus Schekmanbacteria bacterium]|nr:MAG: hypothetical protein D6734_00250 [Candidatus Schekmanbacteria bacterium]
MLNIEERIKMDRIEICNLLKKDLCLEKEIIALRVLSENDIEKQNIPQYEGVTMMGLCSLIGEIQTSPRVFYITKDNVRCPEALISTGSSERLTEEEHIATIEEILENFPYHKDVKTAKKYYDELDKNLVFPEKKYDSMIVGTLEKVEEPDLVLLFLKPKYADMLNRVHAYLGEFVQGFGGTGGCIFLVRYPYVSGKPTFSTSDLAWRTFTGMTENELTFVYPYKKLVEIADEIHDVAEYCNAFGSW